MLEIFFSNLTEEAQQRFLNAAGISKPEEANWDVFPVTDAFLGSEE